MSKRLKTTSQIPPLAHIVILLGLALTACTPANLPEVVFDTAAPEAAQIVSGSPAADAWQSTLDLNPADAEANYQLGLQYSITDPVQSEIYFSAALAGDASLSPKIQRIQDAQRVGEFSDNPAYRLTLLGQALGALEEWDLARQSLLLAVETDPGYAEAWAYLGEAQRQTGEDAFEALSTAISLDPQSYSANLLLALYWRWNDQPGKALPLLLTAAEQDPNNLLLKEDIANTYAEVGEIEVSLALLQENAEQNPALSVSWQMLARLCLTYDLKVEEVGLPAARQAVLLANDDPAALLLLGRVYFQTGNLSLAVRFINQASVLDPGSPAPHYYLGLVYLNQGETAAARAELERAYRLSPTAPVGLQALHTLEEYFGNGE